LSVDEEDRVVDQRVVEGVTVRLIFQKSFPFDSENLQTDAGDRSNEPVRTNVIRPV
jgi:hypothetical protein